MTPCAQGPVNGAGFLLASAARPYRPFPSVRPSRRVLALPIAVITFFARGYVVAFIKNSGQPAIASVLGALVISIFFRTLYHIMARTFYTQQDTRTPLYKIGRAHV